MTTWQIIGFGIGCCGFGWLAAWVLAHIAARNFQGALDIIAGRNATLSQKLCDETRRRYTELAEAKALWQRVGAQAINDEQELALAQRDKLLGVLVMVAPIVLDRAKLRVGQRDGEHAAWIMAGLNHLGVWRPVEKDSRVLARGIQVAGQDRELFQKSFALPVGLRRPAEPEAT